MTKSTLFVFMLCMPMLWAQHELRATFTPAENFEIAILYKINPKNLSYTTHAKFDDDGHLTMALDSTISSGVYRLVYAMPQEVYNFDVMYNAKEDIELKFNQEMGLEYVSSEENKLLNLYYSTMAQIGQNIGELYKKEPLDSLALVQLFKTQSAKQLEFETQSKDLMVHEFIKANKRYVPLQIEPLDQYLDHVKNHYFDAVDFKNPLLMASNFFSEHAINYVFGMTGTSISPELLKDNLESLNQILLDAATPEIRYEIFKVLRLQMLEANYEPLALELSKEILRPLAIALNDNVGLQAMQDFERTAVGSKAPNFELEEGIKERPAKTLYDLDDATSYILIFWSSSCSHCVDEVPQIHNWIVENQNHNNAVVAIGLEEEPYKWNTMKYDMPQFTHVLALGKWEHPLVQRYNITATPFYMVLDQEKTIIAKPQNLEDLKPFIQK